MAPNFLIKFGRGFGKLCCLKVAEEDRLDPPYGVEIVDETPEVPTPEEDFNPEDYKLITLYKADDPDYDQSSLPDLRIDAENQSTSSSEYFTAEEDNPSNTSSSGSLMSASDVITVEAKMNRLFMDLAAFKRQLAQNKTDTMQSDVVGLQRNVLKADKKLKKMFY